MEKIHEDYDVRGVVLRLLIRDGSTLTYIDEIQFDEDEGFMEFNRDGTLLAIV